MERRVTSYCGGWKCDIRIDPDTFRNVRPDPLDRIIMPYGYENRLLAPRRKYWQSLVEGLNATWNLNTVTVVCPESAPAGPVWESVMTPVQPGSTLTFHAEVQPMVGNFRLAVLGEDGNEIASQDFVGESGGQDVSLSFDTADNRHLKLLLFKSENFKISESS